MPNGFTLRLTAGYLVRVGEAHRGADAQIARLYCAHGKGDRYAKLDVRSGLVHRIHQPSHSDTDSVERDHRGSEKTHV